MPDLNEKLDAAAQLNDEELKSTAGGVRAARYGCGKCGYGVYPKDIEMDALGRMRHKGCGGIIYDSQG